MQLRKEVKDESFQNTETPEEIEIQSEGIGYACIYHLIRIDCPKYFINGIYLIG